MILDLTPIIGPQQTSEYVRMIPTTHKAITFDDATWSVFCVDVYTPLDAFGLLVQPGDTLWVHIKTLDAHLDLPVCGARYDGEDGPICTRVMTHSGKFHEDNTSEYPSTWAWEK